ncbi:MAG: hypothetical protein KGZ72_05100 [Roseovarius sp.]|jgi:hypothetical protein|nr:hypothetical protein [Roseovarius sp.]
MDRYKKNAAKNASRLQKKNDFTLTLRPDWFLRHSTSYGIAAASALFAWNSMYMERGLICHLAGYPPGGVGDTEQVSLVVGPSALRMVCSAKAWTLSSAARTRQFLIRRKRKRRPIGRYYVVIVL